MSREGNSAAMPDLPLGTLGTSIPSASTAGVQAPNSAEIKVSQSEGPTELSYDVRRADFHNRASFPVVRSGELRVFPIPKDD